jgi:putative oxidoreductase
MSAGSASIGLLVARLVIGLLMAGHGAQKLFGWFGGVGPTKAGDAMAQLGFRPGFAFAIVAGATEVLSGLLVAVGLFGPVGPALMLSVMIVAIVAVHWSHGVFAMNNGIEVPLLYAIASILFAGVGYGAHSLDALLNLGRVWSPELTWVVLSIGFIGGVANTIQRRPVERQGV